MLATVTVETPQETVEVREVLERGDRVGPTGEETIVTEKEILTRIEELHDPLWTT